MLVSVIKSERNDVLMFLGQFCLANPEVPDLEPGGSGFGLTELTCFFYLAFV